MCGQWWPPLACSCVRPAAEALLRASLALPLALGPLTSNPPLRFIDVLVDLEINVDEALLSLWLSGGGGHVPGLGCRPTSPV